MKTPAVFIDCGANKGQSISAFVDRFPSFKDYRFSYIGYEPSIGFLPKKNQQTMSLEATASDYSQNFSSFQLYPSAVGITNSYKLFWWAYGAGATGLIQKAFNMFIRDLKAVQLKRALRFFKVALVKYIDLPKLLKSYTSRDVIIYLKLDIEGGEFIILEELLKSGILPDYLLIEYHGNKLGKQVEYVQDLHRRMFDMGVQIFLWSADDIPPYIELGRDLPAEDC